MVMEQFGLDEYSKILMKNGYKEDESKGEKEQHQLDPQECRAYRMLAARMNFMAQDNPAIQFAAKEVCRKMSNPTAEDFMETKRLARFITGVMAVECECPWQEEREAQTLRIYVDSDSAGCRKTRRSTSGGLAMLGRHPVKTWSATQSVVATSSAEAELYSMAEGASRGLGFQTMLQELGVEAELAVSTDSSAAKAFASTRGLGRMRHVEVKDLVAKVS